MLFQYFPVVSNIFQGIISKKFQSCDNNISMLQVIIDCMSVLHAHKLNLAVS